MNKFKYIRNAHVVYERVEDTDDFRLVQKHDSISKAKHWSRLQPKGLVRRMESLEREGYVSKVVP